MSYLDAKAQCEFDGVYLAIPRSDDQNAFIASLIPNDNIWIGVNDIDEEGTFAAVDGQEVTYTKWRNGEPNNYGGNEDGFLIVGGTNGMWADKGIQYQEKFVCMSDIISDNTGKFFLILTNFYMNCFLKIGYTNYF